VSEIRLLFAALPAMLSEILRQATEAEPDLHIVEERPGLEDLTVAAVRASADIVVVGTVGGALPRECASLMYDRPRTGALAVSLDGRTAAAYRLRPQGIAMENASSGQIIEAIRDLSLPPPELRGQRG
jgi:hypothetical protein